MYGQLGSARFGTGNIVKCMAFCEIEFEMLQQLRRLFSLFRKRGKMGNACAGGPSNVLTEEDLTFISSHTALSRSAHWNDFVLFALTQVHDISISIISALEMTKTRELLRQKSGEKIPRPIKQKRMSLWSDLAALCRQEVDERYEHFLQKHPDGKITKKEFRHMMQVSGIFQAIFEPQIFRFVAFWFGWFFLYQILFGLKNVKSQGP